MSSTGPYSASFFDGQADGSSASASVVVPIIRALVHPVSVADIGCGVGTWLAEFVRGGVTDVRGYDGGYVDRARLRIDPGLFTAVDLIAGFNPARRFDLALCLEVGEHLPESAARGLVDTLCSCADIVLFSAAIPLQGGTGHLNERPQSWWCGLFRVRGLLAVDAVRPAVWNDDRVAWWYRQNMVLYVSTRVLERDPALRALRDRTHEAMLDLVHPRLLEKRNRKPLRTLAAASAWWRALRGAHGGG